MASRVQPLFIGVDVSKADLAIARSDTGEYTKIDNDTTAIGQWLKSLGQPAAIAIEATNTFHLLLAQAATKRDHTVYLVDGYRLNRYRDSIGGRAKTDRSDAQLLLRYLQREHDQLRPWSPPPAAYTKLHCLLHRRAALVKAKVGLKQSLAGIEGLQAGLQALLQQIDALDKTIRHQLHGLLRQTHWLADAKRCQAIEGIGPLTATALVTAYHRGSFKNSDAFIAFLGMDVRVRESGTYRARRRLTKQGNTELRRLLHNAAMAARRSPVWSAFCQRYLNRGLQPIQVLVILARKLARIAFALLKNQSKYQPPKTEEGCHAT